MKTNEKVILYFCYPKGYISFYHFTKTESTILFFINISF